MKKKLLYLIGLGVVGFVVYDVFKYLKEYDPNNFEDEDIFEDEEDIFEDEDIYLDSKDDFFEEED